LPDAARPSLLWPGEARRRLPRREWWLLGAAYALALAVRWTIRGAQPYTAEAAHFAMSVNLWHGVRNIGSLFPDVRPDTFSWFFWQRPLLCLLYWPGAQMGFAAYRVQHVLVAATVPPLAALLLRHLGTRPAFAHGAAAILAVHPVLVPWGVLVLPDTTVAAFTLLGLLAAHDGRPFATAALLLAGAWVKEVEFVAVGALLALALWRDADGRRAGLWPLRLGRFATVLLPTLLLCFLPLAVSLALPDSTVPGLRVGGTFTETLERCFLLLWLAPIPLVGLLVPKARRFCLAALAWPAFFLLYHGLTHKAVEIWYNVVPATMTLCAAVLALSHLGDAVAHATPAPRHAVRAITTAATALFAALLLVQVAVPSSAAANRAVATPISGAGQWDLAQALRAERERGQDLVQVLAAIPPERHGTWLALNVDYSIAMYPLASQAKRIDKDFTLEWDMSDATLRGWADSVENRTDATILGATPDSLSRALVDAYAPCAHAAGIYTAIVPDACRGYGDRLVAAWHYERTRMAASAGATGSQQA